MCTRANDAHTCLVLVCTHLHTPVLRASRKTLTRLGKAHGRALRLRGLLSPFYSRLAHPGLPRGGAGEEGRTGLGKGSPSLGQAGRAGTGVPGTLRSKPPHVSLHPSGTGARSLSRGGLGGPSNVMPELWQHFRGTSSGCEAVWGLAAGDWQWSHGNRSILPPPPPPVSGGEQPLAATAGSPIKGWGSESHAHSAR